jgi:hypothetical protein
MTQCSGAGSSSAARSANGDASRARPLALGGRGSERGAWGVVGGRSAAALNNLPWWLELSACCTVAGQSCRQVGRLCKQVGEGQGQSSCMLARLVS